MAVKEKGCFYCDPDHQGRKDLMIEVGQMKEGVLYLFKDQAHLGRCVVAVPEHKSELFDLEPKQRHDYIDDVAAAARAIKNSGDVQRSTTALTGTSCLTCIFIWFPNMRADLSSEELLPLEMMNQNFSPMKNMRQ